MNERVPAETRGRSRAWWAIAAILFGCDGAAPTPDPVAQFQEVVEAVQSSDLAAAYSRWLPAAYREDVDGLISGFTALVDEKDHERLAGAIDRIGGRIAALRAQFGSDDPIWDVIAERVPKLSSLLGAETYAKFRALDAETLLRTFSDGIARELMSHPVVAARFRDLRLELVERRNDWARLRLTVIPEEGPAASDEFELIRVDSKWVIDDWVVDWPKAIGSLRQELDALGQLKAEDPSAFAQKLDAWIARMKAPGFLYEDILPKIAHLAPGDAGTDG